LLLGIEEGVAGESVRLELPSKEVLEIPRNDIARAHLLFRWEE
jgi:hypothetical protein